MWKERDEDKDQKRGGYENECSMWRGYKLLK